MVIRFGYTIFIGILLATFIGVGIAAFYKGPAQPDYPARLKTPTATTPSASESAEQIKEQEVYDTKQKVFQKQSEDYNKNVSIIALVFSIVILVLGLTFVRRILVIADGLVLGGVLTLIYSIIRGFSSGDSVFRFIVVSVSLLVALILGYLKFIQPQTSKKSR